MKTPLNKLFWFTDPKILDIESDKDLIIHQTLAYGSLKDIQYLFKTYSKKIVRNSFLKERKGLYDPRALAFAQSLLGIQNLNERNYIKYVSKIPS